jgi:hypothetical protein
MGASGRVRPRVDGHSAAAARAALAHLSSPSASVSGALSHRHPSVLGGVGGEGPDRSRRGSCGCGDRRRDRHVRRGCHALGSIAPVLGMHSTVNTNTIAGASLPAPAPRRTCPATPPQPTASASAAEHSTTLPRALEQLDVSARDQLEEVGADNPADVIREVVGLLRIRRHEPESELEVGGADGDVGESRSPRALLSVC